MKQPAYLNIFSDKNAALERARLKNRANRLPGWLWVVTDGPSDDFVVMDLRTAIELGNGYEWAV